MGHIFGEIVVLISVVLYYPTHIYMYIFPCCFSVFFLHFIFSRNIAPYFEVILVNVLLRLELFLYWMVGILVSAIHIHILEWHLVLVMHICTLMHFIFNFVTNKNILSVARWWCGPTDKPTDATNASMFIQSTRCYFNAASIILIGIIQLQ